MSGPPPLIDHLGWDLTRVARAWAARYHALWAEAGFDWADQARGALIPHIGRHGASQAEIARRAGLTRQAVQRHITALEADGIVRRLPDPEDARNRIVVFSAEGYAALAAGDRIKKTLEAEIDASLGPRKARELRALLEQVRTQLED